jgi:hypothetical protein
MLEQRVAGRFFDFSLTHPARSDRAVVQQRERPRRSVTARQPAPCRCQGRSLQSRCEAKRSSLDRDLEGPAKVSARKANDGETNPGQSEFFRRSELVLACHCFALLVQVLRRNVDQMWTLRQLFVNHNRYCPVSATGTWLDVTPEMLR